MTIVPYLCYFNTTHYLIDIGKITILNPLMFASSTHIHTPTYLKIIITHPLQYPHVIKLTITLTTTYTHLIPKTYTLLIRRITQTMTHSNCYVHEHIFTLISYLRLCLPVFLALFFFRTYFMNNYGNDYLRMKYFLYG